MTVSTFIKENRVLVAGLALPLLLIAILAIAKALPATMIDPPHQKIAFYTQDWSPKGQISFSVNNNGNVTATFHADQNYKPSIGLTPPKSIIYIYDPQTGTTEKIDFILDKDDQPTLPDKLASLKLSAKQPSADGYTFQPYQYRDHSLITEIFVFRQHNSGPVLTKNGRVIPIPNLTPYANQTIFLGWQEDGEKE